MYSRSTATNDRFHLECVPYCNDDVFESMLPPRISACGDVPIRDVDVDGGPSWLGRAETVPVGVASPSIVCVNQIESIAWQK